MAQWAKVLAAQVSQLEFGSPNSYKKLRHGDTCPQPHTFTVR